MAIMDEQPSLTISGVVAAVTAILGLLVSFKVGISPEQQKAILTCTTVIAPAIIVGVGLLIKQFVYSKKSAVTALSLAPGTTVEELDAKLAEPKAEVK